MGKERKLEIKANVDETSATFVLRDEDHTLGNSLRYMLAKNPDVSFCGYSVPHPSENVMNVRVQTRPGLNKPVSVVVEKGLEDLKLLCEHLASVYEQRVNEKESHAMQEN